MLSSIETRGYYSTTNVITPEAAENLRAYMDVHYGQDQFKKAGVGKGAALTVSEDVRKDSTLDRQRAKEWARFRLCRLR